MAGSSTRTPTHIVDLYHTREHLHDLAAHLAFTTPDPPQWLADRLDDLDAGKIEAIIDAARQHPLDGIKAEDLDKKLRYFEHNIHRMRYARFRNLGMFTGSGAIEAACKQIVAARAKRSGMHWTVEGAADIIALRCQHPGGTSSGQPAPTHQPGHAPPSDRQHNLDTQPRAATKIIPSDPVVHPRRYSLGPDHRNRDAGRHRRRQSARIQLVQQLKEDHGPRPTAHLPRMRLPTARSHG
jgi:hypothetical protein